MSAKLLTANTYLRTRGRAGVRKSAYVVTLRQRRNLNWTRSKVSRMPARSVCGVIGGTS